MTDVTSFEAWRDAVRRFASKGLASAQQHPIDALNCILMKHGTMNGMATSEIEQALAKECQLWPAQRQHCLESTECDESALHLDSGSFSESQLFTQVWMRCGYGAVRSVKRKRIDQGNACTPQPLAVTARALQLAAVTARSGQLPDGHRA